MPPIQECWHSVRAFFLFLHPRKRGNDRVTQETRGQWHCDRLRYVLLKVGNTGTSPGRLAIAIHTSRNKAKENTVHCVLSENARFDLLITRFYPKCSQDVVNEEINNQHLFFTFSSFRSCVGLIKANLRFLSLLYFRNIYFWSPDWISHREALEAEHFSFSSAFYVDTYLKRIHVCASHVRRPSCENKRKLTPISE